MNEVLFIVLCLVTLIVIWCIMTHIKLVQLERDMKTLFDVQNYIAKENKNNKSTTVNIG